MDRQAHWDRIYSTRPAEELSWFQKHPTLSIELIERTGGGPRTAVIDIGGGDSLLIDGLLELGYDDLTVLDVSPAALDRARLRLEDKAESVRWIAGDVISYEPEREYDLWHDRAVFHFLTAAADRCRYVEVMGQALKPGGQAIIATFSLEGPPKCSGLEVQRYSVESLTAELGAGIELIESRPQVHQTPAGESQPFVYCRLARTAER